MISSFFANLSNSKKIIEFENLFAKNSNRKYCVSFPFARTAIYFALKAKNIPKGSEIIMPPISIKGILDVVISLGLVPIYVDLDLQNFCLKRITLKMLLIKIHVQSLLLIYLEQLQT